LNAFQAQGSATPLLEVRGLHKSFGGAEVLRGVDFLVDRGDKVCIIGPSGSGKTTLLRCLNLLVEPTRGEQYFRGELVGRWPGGARVALGAYRSRISMVFQHFELFPHLTALQNITLGPRHVLHEDRQIAGPSNCSIASASAALPRPIRAPCPAVRSSASQSPGRWRCSRT